MPTDMGTFRVDIEIENPVLPGVKRPLNGVLVDTGAELSWVPASLLESLEVERNAQWQFRQADGTILSRWTGTVVIHLGNKRAGDEVVFGEPSDLTLLGSRTLEGLNLRVEPVTKKLVDAGPAPAAVATATRLRTPLLLGLAEPRSCGASGFARPSRSRCTSSRRASSSSTS